MPSHPDRVRSAPLSQGFQFGDGAKCGIVMRYLTPREWRAWHLNAAERLARQAPKPPLYWNVIEGEHFSTDRDHGDEG